MKNNTIITVKEWFFDKLNSQMLDYHCMIVGEYQDGRLDHTKLRVDEVLAETEKAYKVAIDAETQSGRPKTWTAWLPKSVIVEDCEQAAETGEDVYRVVYTFYNELGEHRKDALTNNGEGLTKEEAERVAYQLRERENVTRAEVVKSNLKTYDELRQIVCGCDDAKQVIKIEEMIWDSLKLDTVEAEDLVYMLSYICRERNHIA